MTATASEYSPTPNAEGSHCHQEILIKHLAVADIPECLIYNVPSYKNIGNQIQGHLSPHPQAPPAKISI